VAVVRFGPVYSVVDSNSTRDKVVYTGKAGNQQLKRVHSRFVLFEGGVKSSYTDPDGIDHR
jgi:hypothetical protein